MACTHGKDERTCLYCSAEKTHSLVAKQTAIQAAAAAEQSAFIAEQRYKANLKEVAESVRASMRHDYLKLVRESKSKTIDFGSGAVTLDVADVELYWAEYREFQFNKIEINREALKIEIGRQKINAKEVLSKLGKEAQFPKMFFGIASFIILVLALLQSSGAQILFGMIGILLGLAGSLGFKFVKKSMPKFGDEWMNAVLDALPWAAIGYSLFSTETIGIILCVLLIAAVYKIKPMILMRNPEYKAIISAIGQTEQQLADLPSQELLTAIRRLN